MKVPKDCQQRKIGSKAKAILHYKLNTNHWEYKEETGCDFGRDCIIELSENDEWRNHKIECQIKGKIKPTIIKNGEFISIPIELKTLNYAIGSPIAFVVFVVNVTNETVYYQSIQEYFIGNKQEQSKLDSDNNTLNIHIPVINVLSSNDCELQKYAKKVYA